MTESAGGRRGAADEEAPGCTAVVAVRTPALLTADCRHGPSCLADWKSSGSDMVFVSSGLSNVPADGKPRM